MAFDLTILTAKINKIKESFENGRFGDALVGALNTGSGLMQQRIFQQNTDIKGRSFGKYSKKDAGLIVTPKKKIKGKPIDFDLKYGLSPYEKKRVKHGRQVARKDLEFDGGLRRAIETQVENEKSVVLEFNNDLAAKIAKGQEQQIENIRSGKPGTTKGTGATRIFTFDEKEREQVTEQGQELILQILKS